MTSGSRARVWFSLFVLAVFCLGGCCSSGFHAIWISRPISARSSTSCCGPAAIASGSCSDVRGRFDEEQRSLHEEIRKILTSDQQTRFDRFIQEGRRGRGPDGEEATAARNADHVSCMLPPPAALAPVCLEFECCLRLVRQLLSRR